MRLLPPLNVTASRDRRRRDAVSTRALAALEPAPAAGVGCPPWSAIFSILSDIDGATLRRHCRGRRALKATRRTPSAPRPLAGRTLAMIFEKPSTRTRVSFDVAMRELGGETIILAGGEMQLGRGETIADTARVLSRYVDAIMIRILDHGCSTELAANASIPVINGLTERSHPCQVMADVMTFEEHKGPIAGRTGRLDRRRQQRARLVGARRRALRLPAEGRHAAGAGAEARTDGLGDRQRRGCDRHADAG